MLCPWFLSHCSAYTEKSGLVFSLLSIPSSPRVNLSCTWRAIPRAYSRVPPTLRFVRRPLWSITMYHEPRSFLTLTDILEAPTFFQLFKAAPEQNGHLGRPLLQSAVFLCESHNSLLVLVIWPESN